MIVSTQPISDRSNVASVPLPVYATLLEWCRISGMGRSATYEALGRGELRARKVGSRTLIDVGHALGWIDRQPLAIIRPHGASSRST